MTKLDKETLRGFSFIEAEIHHARDTGDTRRLKNIKQRLGNLQKLVQSAEEDLKAKA